MVEPDEGEVRRGREYRESLATIDFCRRNGLTLPVERTEAERRADLAAWLAAIRRTGRPGVLSGAVSAAASTPAQVARELLGNVVRFPGPGERQRLRAVSEVGRL